LKKIFKGIFYLSFIVYIFVLISILFLRYRGHISGLSMSDYINYNSNVIPFKTISTYIQAMIDGSMNADIPIKNLLGNLILFLPMGIYLPYIFTGLSSIRNYILTITVILISVEIGQLILRRGSLDIDDFILNVFGAVIGFAIGKVKWIQHLLDYILNSRN